MEVAREMLRRRTSVLKVKILSVECWTPVIYGGIGASGLEDSKNHAI